MNSMQLVAMRTRLALLDRSGLQQNAEELTQHSDLNSQ